MKNVKFNERNWPVECEVLKGKTIKVDELYLYMELDEEEEEVYNWILEYEEV